LKCRNDKSNSTLEQSTQSTAASQNPNCINLEKNEAATASVLLWGGAGGVYQLAGAGRH